MTELTPQFDDSAPLYEQLYRYIVAQIRSGALPEGEKLPSCLLYTSPSPRD